MAATATEDSAAVAETADTNALLSALNDEKESDVESSMSDFAKDHPLFNENMLMPNINEQGGLLSGPVVGYARAKSRDEITRLINIAFDKKVLDSRTVKFLWGAKP